VLCVDFVRVMRDMTAVCCIALQCVSLCCRVLRCVLQCVQYVLCGVSCVVC